MNDINFTKALIKNIENKGKYTILYCMTQVKIESGGFMDANLIVYIDSNLFKKKNEEKNSEGIMSIGNSICITGKTVCDVVDSQITFNILVENQRRIERARSGSAVIVKLFDVYIEKLVWKKNPFTQRIEVLCNYYNSDDKSNPRNIIVSTEEQNLKALKSNSSYNLSGDLRIRKTTKSFVVIYADTFVGDTILSKDIYIPELDDKKGGVK